MEDNGLESMTFWLPETRFLTRLPPPPEWKIWGKLAKHRHSPPQTIPSLSSIFVQSQRRKPLFLQNNPYSRRLFRENPYDFSDSAPPPESSKFCAKSENPALRREERNFFHAKNTKNHDSEGFFRGRRGIIWLRCENRRKPKE